MNAQITHALLSVLLLGLISGVPFAWKVAAAHLSAKHRAEIQHYAGLFVRAAEMAKAQGMIDAPSAKNFVKAKLEAMFPNALSTDIDAVIEASVCDLKLAQAAATSTPAAPAAPAPTAATTAPAGA